MKWRRRTKPHISSLFLYNFSLFSSFLSGRSSLFHAPYPYPLHGSLVHCTVLWWRLFFLWICHALGPKCSAGNDNKIIIFFLWKSLLIFFNIYAIAYVVQLARCVLVYPMCHVEDVCVLSWVGVVCVLVNGICPTRKCSPMCSWPSKPNSWEWGQDLSFGSLLSCGGAVHHLWCLLHGNIAPCIALNCLNTWSIFYAF